MRQVRKALACVRSGRRATGVGRWGRGWGDERPEASEHPALRRALACAGLWAGGGGGWLEGERKGWKGEGGWDVCSGYGGLKSAKHPALRPSLVGGRSPRLRHFGLGWSNPGST